MLGNALSYSIPNIEDGVIELSGFELGGSVVGFVLVGLFVGTETTGGSLKRL